MQRFTAIRKDWRFATFATIPFAAIPNHLYAGSHLQNMLDKVDRKRSSGVDCFYGVTEVLRANRKRYIARFSKAGRQVHIGTFSDPVSAAVAYDEAIVETYGNVARLNFPQVSELED